MAGSKMQLIRPIRYRRAYQADADISGYSCRRACLGLSLRRRNCKLGYHHEKWNGTGYPRKLKGEEIPLEGRIMAIADVYVYDALVSDRPYKKPFTHEQAVKIIKKDSGAHFDPKLVEVFLNVADAFRLESMNGK